MPYSMVLTQREMRMALVRYAAARYDVPVSALLGPSFKKRYCEARWLAMALLRSALDVSYTSIGALFGRSHTTIIYGLGVYFGHNMKTHRDGYLATIAAGLEARREELQRMAEDAFLAQRLRRHQATLIAIAATYSPEVTHVAA
jgi:hypothetical protein